MTATAESYSVKRRAKAPISTHPAFPGIVALWFAALLGFGSLVLPVALLERLVTGSGIAALVPSAAPPLGFMAHAAIALGGALVGTLVGLVLARKVARAHAPESKAHRYDGAESAPRRPISAHDELGEEGLDSADEMAPALALRRRALAMSEDNRRSTYLQAVPLPGHPQENHHDDFAAAVEASPAVAEQVAETVPEPLELGDYADAALDEFDEAPHETDPALEALRSRIHTLAAPTSFQDQPMTDRGSFDQPFGQDFKARQEFTPFPAPEEDEADVYETNSGGIDPLPFAAPSLRRAVPVAFDEEEAVNADEDETYEDEPAPHLSIVEPDDVFEAVGDDRPLGELGLVQLAARLGASLKKRKAMLAARGPVIAPVVAAPLASTEDFEAAEAEDAARAIADFFGPAKSNETAVEPVAKETAVARNYGAEDEDSGAEVAVPAPFRSLSVEADDDGDDEAFAASFSLPIGKVAATPVQIDDAEEAFDEEVEEEGDDEGDYSSLLAIKNPFVRQQEFVRVDEPEEDSGAIEPTVTFPSAAPVKPVLAVREEPATDPARPFDPPKNPANSAAPAFSAAAPRDAGDAERNLRAALATLQRMSGAA